MINNSWEMLVEDSKSLEYQPDSLKPALYPLTSYQLIEISGEGAEKLLQGQVTCDVAKLTETQGSFGSICTPKGRMYGLFKIAKFNECYLLSLPEEIASEFVQRIDKYRQFFKAEIKIKAQWVVLGLSVDDAPQALTKGFNLPEQANTVIQSQSSVCYRLPTIAPCWELWIEKDSWLDESNALQSSNTVSLASEALWRKKLISGGIPELTSKTIEQYIPQALNVDKIGGISFKKGCYTGQEIVARTQYLGKQKRQMYQIHQTEGQPLEEGLSLKSLDGRALGTVVNYIVDKEGGHGLAILPSEIDGNGLIECLAIDNETELTLHLSLPNYPEPPTE